MNPNIPIKEIMSTRLVTVRPEDSLEKVREVFDNNSFHHIPVTDRSGALLGIISHEDFSRVAYILGSNKMGEELKFECNAKDIMTKYPMNLDPEDTIGLAADIILANKFHALPIMEDGQIQGIVTSHDLLNFSFRSPVDEDTNLMAYEEP
jgi:acetoin utilization protein AcuB